MSQVIRLLQELQKGKSLAKADEKMSELINAIRSVGKKGSVTIKLSVRSLNEGSVHVEATVSASIPEVEFPPSIFFTTEENGLSRKDPNQEELKLTIERGGLAQEVKPQTATA